MIFIVKNLVEEKTMNKQQESKNIGVTALILMLLVVMVNAAFIVLAFNGYGFATLPTILLEIAIFIPVILYLKKNNLPMLDALGYHRIKISTVLLTILLTIVITPVWVFGNLFSQLFVPNTTAQAISGSMNSSALLTMLVVSLMPPIFEEICCRGFLFNQYRKTSGALSAALISALFFGLFHLNFNQFFYAFLLGVIFAFVNTASGSILTSTIMHFLINGSNMLLLYAINLADQMTGGDSLADAEAARQSGILPTVAISFVVAVIFAFISKKVMQVIAKNEGHLEEFNSLFKKNSSELESRASVFTVPMVITIILGTALTIIISFVMPAMM